MSTNTSIVDSSSSNGSIDEPGLLGLQLHLAAFAGHLDKCKILISNSADVNKKDGYGSTALHYACQGGNSCVEILHILILAGADVNAQNMFGDTPIHMACKACQRSLCGFLLAKHARTDILNHENHTAVSLARALDRNSILELFDRSEKTKLLPDANEILQFNGVEAFMEFTMSRNDFAAAEVFLLAQLQQHPGQVRLLHLLALVYASQRRMQEARDTHQLAYESDATSVDRLIDYALLLEDEPLRDFTAAEKLFKEAIALKAENPEDQAQNVARLGDLYESMGDRKKATQQYKEAIKIYPDCFLAKVNLARLIYNKAQLRKDVSMLDSAAELVQSIKVTRTPVLAQQKASHLKQFELARSRMLRGEVSSPCSVCGQHARSRCARCTGPLYCSRECQVGDWQKHKATCSKPSSASSHFRPVTK